MVLRNLIPSGAEILDGANGCEINKTKVKSLADENETRVVEVDEKSGIVSDYVCDFEVYISFNKVLDCNELCIEDGKDIESNSSRKFGDNNGVVILDNSGAVNGNNKCLLIINEPHISKKCDKAKATSLLKFDKMCAGIDDQLDEIIVSGYATQLAVHGGMEKFEKNSVKKNVNDVLDRECDLGDIRKDLKMIERTTGLIGRS